MSRKITLVLIILVHLSILSILIFFPYPELFIYSYLTKSGLLPYKQIFDQHFPGLLFLPVNFATLGITTPNSMRVVHYLLLAANHILIYKVAKKTISDRYVLIPNLLYLFWQPFIEGYTFWIENMITPQLLLVYLIHFRKESLWKYFVMGIILGISLVFKQVSIIIFILLLATYWIFNRNIKNILVLLLGFIIPPLLMVVYFIGIGVWSDFWFWTVKFNLTTFAKMGKTQPGLKDIIKISPIFLVLFYSLDILIKEKREIFKDARLLAGLLVGSAFFAYARFDMVHLQPFIALAAVFIGIVFPYFRKRIKYIVLTCSIFICIYPIVKYYGPGKVMQFGRDEMAVAEKVKSLTNNGDSVYSQATIPHIYQLTNTLPPGRVFVFQFPWFMIEAGDRIYNGILEDNPKIIIRDKKAEVDGYLLLDFQKKISEYIESNYEIIDTVNGIDILTKI